MIVLSVAVMVLTGVSALLAERLRAAHRDLRLAEKTVAAAERFVDSLERAERITAVTSCERTKGGTRNGT